MTTRQEKGAAQVSWLKTQYDAHFAVRVLVQSGVLAPLWRSAGATYPAISDDGALSWIPPGLDLSPSAWPPELIAPAVICASGSWDTACSGLFLDVGPAAGNVLASMRQLGLRVYYLAVEPNRARREALQQMLTMNAIQRSVVVGEIDPSELGAVDVVRAGMGCDVAALRSVIERDRPLLLLESLADGVGDLPAYDLYPVGAGAICAPRENALLAYVLGRADA